MRILLGICKPRKSIIGLVLAGVIEEIGKDIKRFKIGDQVYGLTGYGLGAYAEYKCMKERFFRLKTVKILKEVQNPQTLDCQRDSQAFWR